VGSLAAGNGEAGFLGMIRVPKKAVGSQRRSDTRLQLFLAENMAKPGGAPSGAISGVGNGEFRLSL